MRWLNDYAKWRGRFEAVLDPKLYTIKWLDERLADGTAHFSCCDDAAIVTEFRHYPTGAKDIHGLIAAGSLNSIVGVLIPQAEQFARDHGCVGAIIESREGWMKALLESGYTPYQTSIRKVL